MSHKFQTRQLITAELATYVAPSQVPHGESLEDEIFQSMFVSPRDFKPATTILKTAGHRSIYFDVEDAQNKMMQKFDEEVMKLRYNKKEMKSEGNSYHIYFIQLLSILKKISRQDPGFYIKRKSIQF